MKKQNITVLFGSTGLELHLCKRPFKQSKCCCFNKRKKYYLNFLPIYISKYSNKSKFPAYVLYKNQLRFYKSFEKEYVYSIPLNKDIYDDIIEI